MKLLALGLPGLVLLAAAAGCSGSSTAAARTTAPVGTTIAAPVSAVGSTITTPAASGGAVSGPTSSGVAPIPAPDIADLPAARAAVEQALGGPQRYTEINVQPGLVNLFVVKDAANELAYVYRSGHLEPPDAPSARQPGSLDFDLTGIDLAVAGTLEATVQGHLAGAKISRISLMPLTNGVVWTATVPGSRGGGAIDVEFSPSGTITGVIPR